MTKGWYDHELSKSDPLQTVHVKIPTSIKKAVASAAAKRQWHPAVMIREILVDWERGQRTAGTGSAASMNAVGTDAKKRKAN